MRIVYRRTELKTSGTSAVRLMHSIGADRTERELVELPLFECPIGELDCIERDNAYVSESCLWSGGDVHGSQLFVRILRRESSRQYAHRANFFAGPTDHDHPGILFRVGDFGQQAIIPTQQASPRFFLS